MALMSITEYSRYRKIDQSYISRLKTKGFFDGAIVKIKGKKRVLIDSTKADILLNQHRDPNYVKGGATTTKERLAFTESFAKARTETERYRAADLKLNFEIKQGKWVSKVQVRDESFKAGRIFRDAIMNVGPRVAAILAAELGVPEAEHKVLRVLHKEHEQALNEIVRMLNTLAACEYTR